jgi:hypothetical protein
MRAPNINFKTARSPNAFGIDYDAQLAVEREVGAAASRSIVAAAPVIMKRPLDGGSVICSQSLQPPK